VDFLGIPSAEYKPAALDSQKVENLLLGSNEILRVTGGHGGLARR
jgi:hypothetical protein